MRIVIALGGNALLRRGEPLTAKAQARNVGVAAAALATLGRDHGLVVTHGNGPQVGLLALQDAAIPESGGFPLDVLGAESTGMIGYMVAQEFRNRLPGRQIATLLTQIEVDPRDPAFQRPTKPIGPVYEEAEARALATRRGWTIAPDGNGYRRVVPSPKPLRILEVDTLKLLAAAGVVVICAGGGGIPVVFDPWGNVHGVEAVIEKDLSAALVAREVTADALLLLTDAEAVYTDWGTDSARPIRYATPEEIRRYSFPEGSMGPKVAAAADFVERTGGIAGIGRLRDAEAILRGRAGTLIQSKPRAGG
jgi:carbamate kinase